MLDKKTEGSKVRQPSGFTRHSGGLASEHAREQGWGMNEEERGRDAEPKQVSDGGTDYGATNLGDSALDTSAAQPVTNAVKRIICIPFQRGVTLQKRVR
ncbi:MAG TPA: hypothetical protein VFD98_11755 [Terracidiphilus sp.]|jgi:hypothetical protein|nr:hypothetical protein [Terracidiphilus sp.]